MGRNDTRKGTETYGEAARRLLAKMDERKMIKAQPRFLVTAETRGLGLSEEKNRHQLPRAFANDNERQGLDRVLRGGGAFGSPQPLPTADEQGAPTNHEAEATFGGCS